ncbi:MAG TPA: hypothetical protein VN306_19560 [Mycobacterium sp.]|nr:hypothetical protein [Mycobacterium sp.]
MPTFRERLAAGLTAGVAVNLSLFALLGHTIRTGPASTWITLIAVLALSFAFEIVYRRGGDWRSADRGAAATHRLEWSDARLGTVRDLAPAGKYPYRGFAPSRQQARHRGGARWPNPTPSCSPLKTTSRSSPSTTRIGATP